MPLLLFSMKLDYLSRGFGSMAYIDPKPGLVL